MLTILFNVLIGIILATALLLLIDDETPIKVPFLHRHFSGVSLSLRWIFKSDLISSTIKAARKA